MTYYIEVDSNHTGLYDILNFLGSFDISRTEESIRFKVWQCYPNQNSYLVSFENKEDAMAFKLFCGK